MSDDIFRLMRVSGQPVGDAELIDDLRRVATELSVSGISRPKYIKYGKFGATTIEQRFGSWNKGLEVAGLTVVHKLNISDENLFENLLRLWQHYGRQPRRNELAQPPSVISQAPYNRRFGSWTAALQAFVIYANSVDVDLYKPIVTATPSRRTGRDPSLRLRWQVLRRDRFCCRACGASPAFVPGVELHVDHMIAWSNGGETTFENLQTLCLQCNLGKSNVG